MLRDYKSVCPSLSHLPARPPSLEPPQFGSYPEMEQTLMLAGMLTSSRSGWVPLALYGMSPSGRTLLNCKFRQGRVDSAIRRNQENHETLQHTSPR
jgi:hypothetical protein